MEIALPKDDELLNVTQRVRLRLINAMTANDLVPVDPKEIKALASIMKDMDSQVLTKQRLVSENDNAKNDRETALEIAKMSEHIARSVGGNPFKAGPTGIPRMGKNDAALPTIEVIPGQTDIGSTNTTYREFMDEHGVGE